jgi:hypothetical protein
MGATPEACQAALQVALGDVIAALRQHEGFRLPAFDGLSPEDA